MKVSRIIYGNNTGSDLSMFHSYIVAFVRDGVALPEEMADLFTVTIVEVSDGVRGIVNWA